MNPIELKARLLCEGANPEDEASVKYLQSQNPQRVLRGGLSSGLKVKLQSSEQSSARGFPQREIKVNFPLYSKIPVALKIKTTEAGLAILEDGQELGRAEILEPPAWYDKDVEGYPITSIVTLHGDQLTGSVYEWCALFNTGQQCRFCVIDRSQRIDALRSVPRKAALLMEALKVISRESYRGLNLNGGMTFSGGRGLEVIIPVIRRIRAAFSDLPIAVEITPPQDLGWIEKFAEAGGNSLMMNLETWDDRARRQLIPGKDAFCPKDSYLRAFEKAVEILGKGKVSSCFVVGTEPLNSLKEGIYEIVKYDVIPSPLAGRNFEEFPDYPFKPTLNYREFLEALSFAKSEMTKRKLLPTDEAGCVACGMCDVIGDNF